MTALMVLTALVAPLAAPATAGHNNAHDLNCTPETATNNTGVGSNHTVTCTVSENPVTGTATEVDAEILGVNTSSTGVAGSNANPGGDTTFTPKAPDFTATCTPVGGPPGVCAVTFTWTGINPGTDTLTAWIDDDQNNNTFTEPAGGDSSDADAATGTEEGRNAGPTDDGGSAPGTPGAESEVDDTDVVEKTWVTAITAKATLDCDDDGAPGDVADAPGSDTATNPAGEGELYTCLVWNDNGAGAGGQVDNGIQDGSEAGLTGIRVDAENLNGANDPDTSGQGQSAASPPNNGTADFNDACTTGADGRCTYTLNPTESELGTALLCFWTDEDADTVYAPGGAQNDGAGCATEGGHAPEGNDGAAQLRTDVVRKIWQAAGAGAALDAEPENDANATTPAAGTTHTVTATAYDAFGAVAPNQPIDFAIQGGSRNPAGQICDNVITNASGVATCTYADVGSGANPIAPGTFETDFIDVCISGGVAGVDCLGALNDATTLSPEQNDTADQVEKHWYAGTVPAPASIQLDMEGPDVWPPPLINCGPVFDQNAAANALGSNHTICAEVRDSNSQALPGQQVTFTITGPGNFYNDADGSETFNPAGGDTIIGKTVTKGTDQNGETFAQMTSTEAGTSNVTATVGSLSASGTKPWNPNQPRLIDCEPETATNETGQQHTILCNVKDVAGNNVPGVPIDVIEDGQATIENSNNVGPAAYYGSTRQVHVYTTDAAGNFQIVVNSQQAGSNTIEAAIGADASEPAASRAGAPNDADDDCDSRANEGGPGLGVGSSPGAPAGACFDSVLKDYIAPVQPQCSDGTDNDGDGFIDHSSSPSAGDPGCTSPDDNTEDPNPPQCSDAKDNDGDGKVDTGDPGCTDGLDDTESPDPTNFVGGSAKLNHPNSPFSGKVKSSKKKCEKGRRVTVKRVGGSKVGSDRTNRFGEFTVGHGGNIQDGSYVAKVRKKAFTNKKGRSIVCRALKSNRVQVNHN